MSATTHEIPSSPTPHPNPDFDNLWKAWQPTPKSKSDGNANDSMDMNNLDLNGTFETSSRKTKLEMYKQIISFYHQETNNRMYNKRWEELHDPALVKISLEQRLEQGTKGKDAANSKYKQHNWFGAMYTYALAWGCLIPYHPESLSPTDPKRAQIASFEAAIWSNVAACAISASTDTKLDQSMKVGVIQLGLKAAKMCIDMKESVTVGLMKKACGRATTLREKLGGKDRLFGDDEAAKWKQQVEVLKGEDDKKMLGKVDKSKQVV